MKALAPLILLLVTCSSFVNAGDRPNVLVILSDDLGWGSIGCYGADPALVKTPHLDRIATEGRRFTDACTTSSVCSPTRYSVLTGRYCWRTSLQSEVLSSFAPLHIETTRLTMASLLKYSGYDTAAIGKWHLGYGTAERADYTRELKPGPLEIGFNYHFSVPANHGDLTGVYVENHWVQGLNKESPSEPSPPYVTFGSTKGKVGQKTLALNAPKRVDENVMTVLTDRAVDWIGKQTKEKPFFLYYTPVAVHNPVTPGPQTKGTSPKGGPFCEWIHELDLSVGRLLQALDKQCLADNTLVIFSSDNGGVNKPTQKSPQTDAQTAGLKPVGPFRGGKHDVWEGGFRVPFLVRWPGHVPAASVCDEPLSVVDLLATVASITGSKLPPAAEAAEDSWDMSKALLGQPYEAPLRSHIIVHGADGNFSLRQGPWKWIEGIPADDVKPGVKKSRAEQFHSMLYNLKHDVAETKDLAAERPQTVQQLQSLLERYRNGGYSRELPPVMDKPKPKVIVLPPLTGEKLMEHNLAELPPRWRAIRGTWSTKDGALWSAGTKIAKQGDTIVAPLGITDGTIQYEFNLADADRHSLRINIAQSSFRIVVGRSAVDIALNPPANAPQAEATALIQKKVKFSPNEWQTLRVTLKGPSITVHLADQTLQAEHPALASEKPSMNLIAFEGSLGLRHVVVTK
jgi:arylsulfatase A